MAQTAFPLLRLRCHNMRLIRLLAFNMTTSGHFESLLSARLRLHLWHGVPLKIETALTAMVVA
jgi:hypothetical protein